MFLTCNKIRVTFEKREPVFELLKRLINWYKGRFWLRRWLIFANTLRETTLDKCLHNTHLFRRWVLWRSCLPRQRAWSNNCRNQSLPSNHPQPWTRNGSTPDPLLWHSIEGHHHLQQRSGMVLKNPSASRVYFLKSKCFVRYRALERSLYKYICYTYCKTG